MEQASREWSTAMDASDDIIYILDLDRRILRANTRFCKMAGLDWEEIKGKHIAEIVHPQGEKVPCPVCQAQLEKRDTLLTMEADHPDNPIGRPLEISVKIVRDREGNPLSILMSLHDLTSSRKELEEKNRLETQLKQAQKMEALGTLAGGIAHDFNNILTAILGFGDLARGRLKNAGPSTQEIDEVIKAACRARDLVKYILTFARQGQQDAISIRPHLIVKESLKLLRASIPSTIEIRQEIDEQCGNILIDPSRLHQVMMNLGTNALHAMEEGKGIFQVSLAEKATEHRRAEWTTGHLRRLLYRTCGQRHRPRHGSTDHGPDLRPLFHNQGIRQGHRFRSCPGTWHRQGLPRLYQGGKRGRERNDLQALFSACRKTTGRHPVRNCRQPH